MNPPKQVLAIKTGQLDAAFLPEQWATMAEGFGFKMLLVSQEVWSEMQGSVLVVKEELIRDYPEVVEKLVKISQKATDWINQHPQEAAEIVARQLQEAGGSLFPVEIADVATKAGITSEVLLKSMSRKENCWDNAVMESFYQTLKVELIYLKKYETRMEAKRDIFEYIEIFCNKRKITFFSRV
jgi:NitT/TauT family transport system substrate-binding protein